jgi:hypothetical protein
MLARPFSVVIAYYYAPTARGQNRQRVSVLLIKSVFDIFEGTTLIIEAV